MPKTKHRATIDGQTFTRTSQNRVYSHVVVAQRDKGAAMKSALSPVTYDHDGRNWDFEKKCADGLFEHSAYVLSGSPDFVAQLKQRTIDKGKEFIAQHPDRKAFQDAQRQARIDAVEATDFSKWYDCGWAGRLDLAEKNAGQYRGKSWYSDVRILKAEIY